MSRPAPLELPPVSSLTLIRVLGVVATVCGLLIVAAYQWTLPAVSANRKLAVDRAVLKVVPGAVTSREFRVSPNNVSGPGGEGIRAYAAYDGTGRLKGVAAEGAARGYADMVRVLYAYDPACQCIVGFSVLQTRETPGIGDRVSRDPAFLANFASLDAQLDAAGDALAHPITTVRHGAKRERWEIDAVSGATVTSRAVGRAIHDSAQQLLPRLVPQIGKLERESAHDDR